MSLKRILIVDDAMIMRIRLTDILEKHDFEVVGSAGNGIEALKLYQELKPDIVTLDISMPEMDGVETIVKLKEIDPNVRIIIVSAVGQMQMVIKCLSKGAKDFIVKPFKEDRVVLAVNKLATAP